MNDAERERLYRDRPTKPPDRPKEEIARLGDEIYERDIRRQVEADYDGEVVAIDVVSGKWSIGGDMGRRSSACGRCTPRPTRCGACGLAAGRCITSGGVPCGAPSD